MDRKISPHQFKLLVILSYIGTTILPTPSRLAFDSKQDAWISAILGTILGLLLVWLYNSLGNNFGSMTIVEYIENLLGKWLGKLISILFIIFIFLNCTTLVYILGNFIATQMMPQTPMQATTVIFVIVIIYGTRLGLETFARLGEILYPIIFIILVLFVILISKEVDFNNLQPVFESEIKSIAKGSLLYTSYSTFTLIPLMMIFPAYINNKKEAKKSFLTGLLIGGIIIFIITILCILVLGAASTARSVYPAYVLAQKINIGGIFERIESIITLLWFVTIFFKTILHFYAVAFGLSIVFKLKSYKSLTIPLGMILVVLSLVVHPNSVAANTWSTTTWLSLSLTFAFFLPLLLLIIAKVKKLINILK